MPKPKVKASRKTKATWRKNIDLSGVEAKLENQRAAERVGLAPVDRHSASSAIFVEDRKGDDKLAEKHPRRTLKSLAILNRDTGAPAFTGRARKGIQPAHFKSDSFDEKGSEGQGGQTPEQRARRNGISRREIEKLRLLAGREIKGPFGAVIDKEDSRTSNGPEAVIVDAYNVWDAPGTAEVKLKHQQHLLDMRREAGLSLPDPGQSYNPAAEAHETLLGKALNVAQQEELQRQREAAFKQQWEQGAAQARREQSDASQSHVLGMQVGSGDHDGQGSAGSTSSSSEDEEKESTQRKAARRKTKQQRAKAKRLKEEIRSQEAIKASKRTRAQLAMLRSLKKQLTEVEEARVEITERRREAREKRRAQRVGMYKLPKREEEVQLGEDLSESLRGLKPEGNLLRDHLHGFQKRGLIEPKPQRKSIKQKADSRKRKEFETHDYKRFT